MDASIIESYVEKVYGYAVNHTFSREEADDLSQEILFTVVRELPKLKDENKFEPWLWGIASNVTKSFRRHMGKQRAMYSYDIPEDIAYEEDFDNEQEVIYDLLRTKIAMLKSLLICSKKLYKKVRCRCLCRMQRWKKLKNLKPK